jgi:hypothetical protein
MKWDSNRTFDFVNCVQNGNTGILTDVLTDLENLGTRAEILQDDIDETVNKIVSTFCTAAKQTFGKLNNRKHFYKHSDSKPWFNKKCADSRNKARKRYRFLKNVENRKLMRESSKNYKTTLYNEYNIYQQKFADDLRKISKTGSKSIWKILNSIRDEKIFLQ